MAAESERIHATAVAIGGRCALIRGNSGSGKSDLALRCLGLGRSALLGEPVTLVSDDQVILTRGATGLIATAPLEIAGKLEVRGLGILSVPTCSEARVALVVELDRAAAPERLPDPWPKVALLGVEVPIMRLSPFEASAAQKLALALTLAALPPEGSKA